MPALANIVVKKYDGTTDVTFTAINPAGGDGLPALWRNASVGSAPSHHPTLECKSRYNGPKTARRVDCLFTYPQIATDTTTGLVSRVNVAVASASCAVPLGMTTTDLQEFASQFGNLLASSLIASTNRSGFAPT